MPQLHFPVAITYFDVTTTCFAPTLLADAAGIPTITKIARSPKTLNKLFRLIVPPPRPNYQNINLGHLSTKLIIHDHI